MEELDLHHKQLLKAYHRLNYMTKKFISLSHRDNRKPLPEGEEDELIMARDALIKRFEFCYDLTWKFLKRVLKEKYSIDASSPRSVFQECYQQQLTTRDETQILLEMIDTRNETTHAYNESIMDEISQRIIRYYDPLISIINKLAQILSNKL